MATKKLEQSELELQAGQSGQASKQRAHESLVSTQQHIADRTEQARQFDTTVEQRNLDRWQTIRQQQSQERQQRDAQRSLNQKQKPRTTNFGNEGYLEGQEPRPTGDPKLDEQRRQFDVETQQKQQQFETTTDLQAASRGLMRNPRMEALQAEMQQRTDTQMNSGIEQTGRRGFVATPDATKEGARKADLEEREMKARELSAAASFQRAANEYQRIGAQAKAATTATARKELEAKQKIVEESLMQPIKSDAGRLDRFMQGKHTASDMQTLQAMVRQTPAVGSNRALHDEVSSGQIGPAVTQFLGEKVAASAIEFIYATGKLPDGNLVDFSSAGMQEFSRRAMEARQLLMPGTVAGQLLSNEDVNKIKRGYADGIEMVHRLGALLVMKQQPQGPSAALSAPQASTHEHRRANPAGPVTPAQRYGQITPDEAGRRAEAAGGSAAPATSRKPYNPNDPSQKRGSKGGPRGFLPYGAG